MNNFFQGYTFLGYANDWGDATPIELTQCRQLGHKINELHSLRGLVTCYCTKCGIYYQYDNGD